MPLPFSEAGAPPDEVPRGLVFFAGRTSPKRRRRRLLFSGVLLAASLALLWPVYPWLGPRVPALFGLPSSLTWLVFWLVLVFGALVWLYRLDEGEREPGNGRRGKRF